MFVRSRVRVQHGIPVERESFPALARYMASETRLRLNRLSLSPFREDTLSSTHSSLTVPGPIQTGPKAGLSGSSHSHNARHASKTFLRANPRLRWRSDDFHTRAPWTTSTARISGRAELLPEPLHGDQGDGDGHRTSGGGEGRNATLLRRGSLAGPTPNTAELFSSWKAHG